LKDAFRKGLTILKEKYYLRDAGYALLTEVLTPLVAFDIIY
jgi:hypothetical protein